MKSTIFRVLYLIVIVTLVFTGCRAPEQFVASSRQKLPETFPGTADTTGVASLSWREFFGDSLLIELIETGIQNNQDIRIAMSRINIATNYLAVARAARLPSLGYHAHAGKERMGEYTMAGVGNYDTNLSPNISEDQKVPELVPDYYVGLRSSWELDIWGKLRSQKRAQQQRLLASQAAYRAAITELVSLIAITYYELLGLDNELLVLRQNIALQDKALELMLVQKEAGRVTQFAVQQFHAQLLNTRSLEKAALQRLVDTENHLNFLLGRYPQPIRRSSIETQRVPGLATPGLPALMARNRPDIQQARLELSAAVHELSAAGAALYPTIELNAMAGFNSFNSAFLFTTPASFAYSFMGGITGPLFNRNTLRAQKKNALEEARIAEQQLEKTLINAYQESVGHINRIENLRSMADLKKEEAQILTNAVDTSKDLFVTGFASYLEVVTAQHSKLDAELQLATLKRNQMIAVSSLYRSLGGGWR